MNGSLIFVGTDSNGHIRAAERRAIRHHCMSGKNRQPGSRRSRRDAKIKEWRQAAIESQEIARERFYTGRDVAEAEDERPRRGANLVNIPRPPPSDWALFNFAGPLDELSQMVMHKYFLWNPIRDPLCPYQHFGIHLEYDMDLTTCFKALVADQMCFHAILLMCSASNDLISKRPLSQASHRHLRQTLPLLNHRLSDSDAPHDDHVLYAIGILVCVNMLFGDYDTAQIHSKGLAHVVELRGGIVKRHISSPIVFSLERINFASALITETWIPLFMADFKQPPIFRESIVSAYSSRSFLCIDDLVDYDLAKAMEMFQKVSVFFDMHAHGQKPVDNSAVQHHISYMQSTLLALKSQDRNGVAYCIHLGLLILLAMTFRLPGMYQHPCCTALSDVVRYSFTCLDRPGLDLPDEIRHWLVTVYVISTGKVPKDVLRIWMPEILWLSWVGVQKNLRKVFWISSFHDDLGQAAFDKLLYRGKSDLDAFTT